MSIKRIITLLPIAFAVTACASNQAAVQPQTMMAQHQQQQMMIPVQFQASLGMQQQALENLKSFTTAELNGVNERVRRVERAMIRLDRRMQVVERNELARISGNEQAQFQKSSFNPDGKQAAAPTTGRNYAQLTSPFARGAAVLSRTSFNENRQMATRPLTTAVEGKQISIAPLQPVQSKGGFIADASNNNRIASLADKKTDSAASTDVAIWTVSYDPRKIWPDRDQLSASAEVVTALRSDKPITVFARGSRPSSKEFRERVRALSRYLGRVSNLESVPIAAMPAKYLNTDTIEVLVAH